MREKEIFNKGKRKEQMPRNLEPETPEEMLAQLRHVTIPEKGGPNAFRKASEPVMEKVRLTIKFIDAQTKHMKDESERYVTLRLARIECMTLMRTARQAQRTGNGGDKMKEQYDNLMGSIKHLTLLEEC
jgi:hypothetical protein